MDREPVVIVGAGPVGLTLAVGLSMQNVPVVVLEAGTDLSTESRASTFHPPTLEMLDEYGVTDSLISIGLIADAFQYRDRLHGVVAEFPMRVLDGDTRFPFRVQCEQSKLTRLLLDQLVSIPTADVQFNCAVTDVDVSSGGTSVHVAGGRVVHASFVIGADGASSAVRRALGLSFTGKTYEDRYVVFSTTADFSRLLPGIAHVNYIADPHEWLVLLRTPEHWRALFPVRDASASAAEVCNLEAAQARLQGIVQTSQPYEIVHQTLYTVHQRVAERFFAGNVALAGDAAHINNPVGGFGMNSGIHDAHMLSRIIPAIRSGRPAAELLARYERARRRVAVESIAVQSDHNWKMLREQDPAERERHHDSLRATAASADSCRDYLLRACMLNPNPAHLTAEALS